LESCSNLASTGFTIQKHTEKNEQESTGEPHEKNTTTMTMAQQKHYPNMATTAATTTMKTSIKMMT